MPDTPVAHPASEDVPVVEFCGSACWQRAVERDGAPPKGRDVVEEIASRLQLTLVEALNAPLLRVADGCDAALRKMRGCIGACGNGPAARVLKPGSAEYEYFTASSPEAIAKAVRRARETGGDPERAMIWEPSPDPL